MTQPGWHGAKENGGGNGGNDSAQRSIASVKIIFQQYKLASAGIAVKAAGSEAASWQLAAKM